MHPCRHQHVTDAVAIFDDDEVVEFVGGVCELVFDGAPASTGKGDQLVDCV